MIRKMSSNTEHSVWAACKVLFRKLLNITDSDHFCQTLLSSLSDWKNQGHPSRTTIGSVLRFYISRVRHFQSGGVGRGELWEVLWGFPQSDSECCQWTPGLDSAASPSQQHQTQPRTTSSIFLGQTHTTMMRDKQSNPVEMCNCGFCF